jgi:mycothiol synthase
MSVQHLATLKKEQRQQVLDLIQRSTIFDNSPPIAEHILLHLRHGGDKSDSHLVVEEKSKVIGYAHLDQTDLVAGPSVELVVHPSFRGVGIEKLIINYLIKTSRNALRIWARNETETAKILTEFSRFESIRTVLQMARKLESIPQIPIIGEKIKIRSFLPGVDNVNWLKLNNKVFKDHPEQGGWKLSDLNTRLSEDWFDENGFFIVEKNRQLIASTWTKVKFEKPHIIGKAQSHLQKITGEIYITAVDPSYTSLGIGRVLTITALKYFKIRGLKEAILYVDHDNKAAVHLYYSLGFNPTSKNILYNLR